MCHHDLVNSHPPHRKCTQAKISYSRGIYALPLSLKKHLKTEHFDGGNRAKLKIEEKWRSSLQLC